MMTYKGYIAVVEYDEEAELFHGEIVNSGDVITFQSTDAKKLKHEFERSVNAHLKFCEETGIPPEKPFSGKFVIRIPPEVHGKAYAAARRAKKSLNTWVAEQIERAVA